MAIRGGKAPLHNVFHNCSLLPSTSQRACSSHSLLARPPQVLSIRKPPLALSLRGHWWAQLTGGGEALQDAFLWAAYKVVITQTEGAADRLGPSKTTDEATGRFRERDKLGWSMCHYPRKASGA